MKRLIFFLLSAFIYIVISNSSVFAQSLDELSKKLQENAALQAEYQAKLQAAQKQEKTLKSQLSVIDGQVKVTELKIEETNLKIAKLEREINDLSGRITRLSGSVDTISELLLGRIVQTYKYGSVSAIDLLFSSHGFSDMLERLKYIQVAQANDKKVLYQLQATKAAYNDQKVDKEARQAEAEKLSKELDTYKAQLDQEKKAKEELIRVTKNDEAKFQALIVQLRADSQSIRRALGGVGVQVGPRKKGEMLASVGNSGCSTGPHLHFEVMTPAHVEKAGDKFRIVGQENKVDPKPYLDSGQFHSPLASYPNGDCSQGGLCRNGDITTRFNQWYNVLREEGSHHTGLDIADYYGAPIFAVTDGVAYEFQDSQACARTGTVGRGVVLDHDNSDVVTLYWHIP